MMKITKFLLFLSCLLTSQYTFSTNKNVLIFGDSISASYNIPTNKGWVYLLEQELNKSPFAINIANASISGETSTGGLARFRSQIKKSQPNIVILELGANDGLRGFDLSSTHSNLLEMINMSHQTGASVLLAGIHIPPNYGRTYTQKFDKIFTDLAKMENVSLIPFILVGVATNPDLMLDDGLHPNEKGQKIVAKTVMLHLLPLLSK